MDTSIPMNSLQALRKSWKPLLAAGGIGLLAIGSATWYRAVAGRKQYSNKDIAVVQQADLSEKTFLNGTVIANRSINLSPLTPGRLSQLYIQEGESVEANQLIARMKNEELASLIVQLKEQLQGARAEVRQISSRRSRYEKLHSNGAISAEFIDQLRASHTQALANFNDLREKLRNAKRQYSDSFIRAPFAGTITKRYAQAGEYVAPATPASNYAGATSNSIAELSSGIEIQVQVPEARLSQVKIGQPVLYETYAYPGKTFKGVIESVSPRALSVQNLVNFPVVIRPLSIPRGLKLGMEVKVTLASSLIRQWKSVPLAALVSREDGSRGVYVIAANHEPSFRRLELGMVSGNRVQVIKGVDVGEKILIASPSSGR